MKRNLLIISAAAVFLFAACGADGNNQAESAGESETDTGSPDTEASESSNQAFSNFTIDLEHGTIKILSGEEFSFLYADGKDAEYTISDDTLYIQAHEENDLVLTLPAKDTYNRVAISVEEGNIYAEQSLSMKELELDAENGHAELEKLTVSESSDIEIKKSTVLLYGTLTGTIHAECEEAHLNMELAGNQMDYNYRLTVSNAAIQIGDNNYHQSGSETIDNGAAYTMNLSSTQGDIAVNFTN